MTGEQTSSQAFLLTFAPMIDSEACRFALSHYGVPYREHAHAFGSAAMLALWHGRIRIPLLIGDRVRLGGARRLVDHFDALCAPERKLLPADKGLAEQVVADWNAFNWMFGVAVARFAYYHLLPHRELMSEPFSRGVPASEAHWIKATYPLFRMTFCVILQLSQANARKALAQIRATFDETDRRLSDGRPYLVGDRFTLADLALATSAAPLLLPEGFASPMPPPERMPPEMTGIRDELDKRQTARFVRRIYREHRAASL